MELEYFIIFLGVESLRTWYFLILEIELCACRMGVPRDRLGSHAKWRTAGVKLNGILSAALGHLHLFARNSSSGWVLSWLELLLLVKILFLHAVLTFWDFVDDGDVAHCFVFGFFSAALAVGGSDTLALLGFWGKIFYKLVQRLILLGISVRIVVRTHFRQNLVKIGDFSHLTVVCFVLTNICQFWLWDFDLLIYWVNFSILIL